MNRFITVFLLVTGNVIGISGQDLYSIDQGSIAFTSDAPLELIQAESTALRGVFDVAGRNCAFSIAMESFEGFNSPLQRVHFNENYLESQMYPEATFSGKLIENVDLRENGTYEIRVKGDLKIHGVTRERILRGVVEVSDDRLEIRCSFQVDLQEHNIRVPKVVHQKIAETIDVELNAVMHPAEN